MMRYAAAIFGAALLGVAPASGDDPAPKPPGAGAGAEAKAKAKAKAEAGAAADSKAQSADERAIRASVEAFARGYNAGDAQALAGQFSKDAEVIDAEGGRTRGREAIEELLAATFREAPGLKIALTIDSLRFLSPDVALEDGHSTVTRAEGGAPLTRRHLIVHVKRDGRWQIDSEREVTEPEIRPHDRLKDLEWMLGEWTDEGEDSIARTNCHWSKDENYLIREITVQVEGKAALNINQRIGWDPLTRQIKSWEFDSEGGYSEGLWARNGDGWVVKHKGVLPDGRTASATRMFALEKPNQVRWESFDRVVGGEAIPEELSFMMVKIPPAPVAPSGSGGGEKSAPTSSPASKKDQR